MVRVSSGATPAVSSARCSAMDVAAAWPAAAAFRKQESAAAPPRCTSALPSSDAAELSSASAALRSQPSRCASSPPTQPSHDTQRKQVARAVRAVSLRGDAETLHSLRRALRETRHALRARRLRRSYANRAKKDAHVQVECSRHLRFSFYVLRRITPVRQPQRVRCLYMAARRSTVQKRNSCSSATRDKGVLRATSQTCALSPISASTTPVSCAPSALIA
eukprot:6186857-Pleurochrysis_carterae.AAC.1